MYKSYSNKLWKFVLHKFCILFVQYLLLSTLKYEPGDSKIFLKKLENEREIIFDVFSELLSEKDVAKEVEKIDLLINSLTLKVDKVVVSIARLKIGMKKKNFNNKCIKCILRMRGDISRDEKKAMFRVLEKQACHIKSKQRQELGRLLRKTLSTDQLVHGYVEKFKARFAKKRAAFRLKEQNQLNNELLKIEANERLEVEEESMSLRGFLGICEVSYKDAKKKFSVIQNIKNCKYKKMHFSFLDDIIVWRKKPTSKKVKKRVYLVTIDDLGVEGQKYFWFSKKDVIFCLECQTEEQRRIWIKALVFLRQESLSEIKPLEFEEFKAVQGSAVYSELFDADEIDYEFKGLGLKKKVQRKAKEFNITDIEVRDRVDKPKVVDGENPDAPQEDEEETIEGEIKELSIEELSDSSEEDLNDFVEGDEEEEKEGEDEDKGLPEQAKKIYTNKLRIIKGAYKDFQSTEGDGNIYNRAKKWFGFD